MLFTYPLPVSIYLTQPLYFYDLWRPPFTITKLPHSKNGTGVIKNRIYMDLLAFNYWQKNNPDNSIYDRNNPFSFVARRTGESRQCCGGLHYHAIRK